jgi:hypothetical protein
MYTGALVPLSVNPGFAVVSVLGVVLSELGLNEKESGSLSILRLKDEVRVPSVNVPVMVVS